MKNDIYQDITDKIIKQLKAGVPPWHKPWAGAASLPRRATGESYRGINILILLMEQRASEHWLTFKQAKSLGGCVRKGEKGTRIVFYKTLQIDDEKTGKEKTVPVIRSYSVFNAEQIDGLPSQFAPQPAVAINQGERYQPADVFIAKTCAKIEHGGAQACYRPNQDDIKLPEFAAFESAQSYYSIALHELTHWTGHPTRCNRNLKTARGLKNYAKEELTAELGAAFLCAALGLSAAPRPDHAAYIASWLEALKNDKKFIFQSASLAQAACDFLNGLQCESAKAA